MGLGLPSRAIPGGCKHQQWHRTPKRIIQVPVPERPKQVHPQWYDSHTCCRILTRQIPKVGMLLFIIIATS